MKTTLYAAIGLLLSLIGLGLALYMKRKKETPEEFVDRVNKQVGLTWGCHICGKERPDAQISVHTIPLIHEGKEIGSQNIRYCNDNPECIEGVKNFK